MGIHRRSFLQLLAATATVPVPALARSPPRRTIALLFDSLVSPFWVAALERFRQQLTARGWSALEAVSNMDDARQYTQVESVIERGVDGIVIVHTDDKAVIPAIRLANRAGVPMVHFNRAPAPSDAYSVAVVADNRKLMDQTVTALIEMGGQPARPYRAAILLGDLGDANGVQRRDGFNDAVSRHAEDIEVVARIATEWNADKAFAGLRDVLQVHPDIDFLVTSSDFMTPQLEQALRAAGKWHPSGAAGHVLIAGFDGDENGYAQLATGYFDVDGVQNLDYEVELTLNAFERLWAGEHVPRILIDPGFVVTRDTLAAKRDEMWGYGAWKAKALQASAARLAKARGLGATRAGTGAAASAKLGTASAASGGVRSGGVLTGVGWWVVLAGLTGFAKALFSVAALHDVLLAMLPLATLVAGQMLVLLIGQIDLSMTAVMAAGSIVSAAVMTRYASGLGGPGETALGILSFLGIGLAIGIFNGICHAILRVPSFIATLAVMMAGSGAAVWYASTVSDTISIGGLPLAFRFIGYGAAWGIPVALVLSGAALVIVHFVLSRTVAGRWVYALGHNREAARISGVPVRTVTVGVFAASGLCAGVAALIYTSRIETGLPTLGENMLLDIVGAAVIGGVSLFGGRGNIWMVLAGVAFLSVLDKSLQLLGLSLFMVLAVKGCAILVAAMWDAARMRRTRRARLA
jgi:ribose/xylose/arabinose/galactoside ABC-type transport system permease subunit/ABC-type sugar transport system substrate-binding protein